MSQLGEVYWGWSRYTPPLYGSPPIRNSGGDFFLIWCLLLCVFFQSWHQSLNSKCFCFLPPLPSCLLCATRVLLWHLHHLHLWLQPIARPLCRPQSHAEGIWTKNTKMGDIQILQAPQTGQHVREIPRGEQDIPFPIDKRKQPTTTIPPPVHCARAPAQNGPKEPIMGGGIRGGSILPKKMVTKFF